MATFHVGRLQLAQQSIGSHACIKVQAASLSGEECPAISWEEFQVKYEISQDTFCKKAWLSVCTSYVCGFKKPHVRNQGDQILAGF